MAFKRNPVSGELELITIPVSAEPPEACSIDKVAITDPTDGTNIDILSPIEAMVLSLERLSDRLEELIENQKITNAYLAEMLGDSLE
jgi:hypothetical protein